MLYIVIRQAMNNQISINSIYCFTTLIVRFNNIVENIVAVDIVVVVDFVAVDIVEINN